MPRKAWGHRAGGRRQEGEGGKGASSPSRVRVQEYVRGTMGTEGYHDTPRTPPPPPPPPPCPLASCWGPFTGTRGSCARTHNISYCSSSSSVLPNLTTSNILTTEFYDHGCSFFSGVQRHHLLDIWCFSVRVSYMTTPTALALLASGADQLVGAVSSASLWPGVSAIRPRRTTWQAFAHKRVRMSNEL